MYYNMTGAQIAGSFHFGIELIATRTPTAAVGCVVFQRTFSPSFSTFTFCFWCWHCEECLLASVDDDKFLISGSLPGKRWKIYNKLFKYVVNNLLDEWLSLIVHERLKFHVRCQGHFHGNTNEARSYELNHHLRGSWFEQQKFEKYHGDGQIWRKKICWLSEEDKPGIQSMAENIIGDEKRVRIFLKFWSTNTVNHQSISQTRRGKSRFLYRRDCTIEFGGPYA